MEIIEYLEELVDLAKLLVGVNAFRSGMLERPKFHEYARKIKEREASASAAAAAEAEQQHEVRKTNSKSGRGSFVIRRRRFTLVKTSSHATATSTATAVGIGPDDAFWLRRRSTGLWGGGGDSTADRHSGEDAVEDLPVSMQRVMTKRMEDRQRERLARGRRNTDDPKGKRPLIRPAQTWEL